MSFNTLEMQPYAKPVAGVKEVRNGRLYEIGPDMPCLNRVANRLFLHEIGACGMFTAVVPPGERINENVLREVADEAKRVNVQIGLPGEVENLVIRTREDVSHLPSVMTKDSSAGVRLAGTNPMLQVVGINSDHPRFIQLKTEFTEEKRFETLPEWLGTIKPSYLLVHEENPGLQLASIHGRLMSVDSEGPSEISLGNNALHARMIGINGSSYISMAGHDIRWLVESVLNGSMHGVKTLSDNNRWKAIQLVEKVSVHLDRMLEFLDIIKLKYGKDVVLEFRVYPNQYRGEMLEAGLQIYDFDKYLGRS